MRVSISASLCVAVLLLSSCASSTDVKEDAGTSSSSASTRSAVGKRSSVTNKSSVRPPQHKAASSSQKRVVRTVTIQNGAFSPATVNVAVDTVVTWLNRDTNQHSIIGENEKVPFESQTIEPGRWFSRMFKKAGTYPYHCGIDPSMTGTIIVHE